MKSEADDEKGTYCLCSGYRIAFLLGHGSNDFVRNLAILSDRAVRLQNSHNGLEWIPVDLGDALDFFDTACAVLVANLACGIPIGPRVSDLCFRKETGNRFQVHCQVRPLAQPASLRPGQREREP